MHIDEALENMFKLIKHRALIARNYAVYRQYAFRAEIARSKFPLDSNSEFVISVASYPGRIHLVPAVFESLARQTLCPRHAYLVLSEEDYPEHDVPKPIAKLMQRGVEIVWVRDNPYAVKKLMPLWGRHEDCAVITFDDDIIYSPEVISGLKQGAVGKTKCVVGYWGKVLYRNGNTLDMWQRVPGGPSCITPSNHLYLMGGGGIWYSPKALDDRVADIAVAQSIVPGRGSDIWFWAAAHAANADHVWVPAPHSRMWIPIPQQRRTKPKETPGAAILSERFQKAIDYFGIREKLIHELPDRGEA